MDCHSNENTFQRVIERYNKFLMPSTFQTLQWLMAKGGESIAPLADWYTLGSKLSIYNLSVPISWFYLCDHFLTTNVNSTQRISIKLQWRCCWVYGKPSVSVACQKPFMSFYSFLPMLFEGDHFLSNESWLPQRHVWILLAYFVLGETPGYADFIIEIPKIKTGSCLEDVMPLM